MKDGAGRDTQDSAYFTSANRGKKSITLDISNPEGQQLVRELARISDVLIENYKFGDLARYGLDYADLKANQPAPDLLLDHRLRPDRPLPRRAPATTS